MPEFSNSYRVITFDLRGHGRSDKPAGPYRIPMFANDLVGLLEALGLDSAHIVGISLGGVVAFQFAIDYPAPSDDLKEEIERRVGIVQQLGMRGYARALSEVLFPKPEHETLRETFIERWVENDPRAYIEAARSGLGWNVLDKLSSIHCPTFVISAEQDMWPLSVKEAYVKRMPNAQLVVISDAHHFCLSNSPKHSTRRWRTFSPSITESGRPTDQSGHLRYPKSSASDLVLAHDWASRARFHRDRHRGHLFRLRMQGSFVEAKGGRVIDRLSLVPKWRILPRSSR